MGFPPHGSKSKHPKDLCYVWKKGMIVYKLWKALNVACKIDWIAIFSAD